MSDSWTQLNLGVSGDEIDMEQVAYGTAPSTRKRQRIEITGANQAEICRVLNGSPVGTEMALVTRNIPNGIQAVQFSGSTGVQAWSLGYTSGTMASTGTTTPVSVSGATGVLVSVTGAYSGLVFGFQGADGSGNYVSLLGMDMAGTSLATTQTVADASTDLYSVWFPSGLKDFRLNLTGLSSGTASFGFTPTVFSAPPRPVVQTVIASGLVGYSGVAIINTPNVIVSGTVNASLVGTSTVQVSGSVLVGNTVNVLVSGTPTVAGTGTFLVSGVSTQAVNVMNALTVSGTVLVSGVSVQQVAGTITANAGTGPFNVSGAVSVINTPNVQVSGAITVGNTVNVLVSGTPTVAGTGTFLVSGISTQAVNVMNALTVSGTVLVSGTTTQAVSVTNVPTVIISGGTTAFSGVTIQNTPTVIVSGSTGSAAQIIVSGYAKSIPSDGSHSITTLFDIGGGLSPQYNLGVNLRRTGSSGNSFELFVNGHAGYVVQDVVSSFTTQGITITTGATNFSGIAANQGVQMIASSTNSANVYIGNTSGITAGTANGTDGIEIVPGQSMFLPVNNASTLWGISASGNQKVYYLVF